ncbi:MAG: glycoside hydrolase N-terminal domain-containing protein, partial [Rothia sp. (in: high G+C Gram-positive bacteria)]|uniref:glycoside hydrolase N-terminal domain-containing protein n=1 Tax=Rothia sp. (in: high G+C Gram-positive bacteria) TaxID=1885016 RepID=UPI0026E00D41
MKLRSILLACLAFPLSLAAQVLPQVSIKGNPTPPTDSLTLWYTAPATDWVREALPIGNGEMGAMLFG